MPRLNVKLELLVMCGPSVAHRLVRSPTEADQVLSARSAQCSPGVVHVAVVSL